MEKKVPSVFANKIGKAAGNNKDVFYSSKDDDETRLDSNSFETTGIAGNFGLTGSSRPQKNYKNVNQKINEIFNSRNYVYKADVEITLRSGKVVKNIVGKNSTHLITMENELIPITDIVDIEHK